MSALWKDRRGMLATDLQEKHKEEAGQVVGAPGEHGLGTGEQEPESRG